MSMGNQVQRVRKKRYNKIRIHVEQLDIYIVDSDKNRATRPLAVVIEDEESNSIISFDGIVSRTFDVEDLQLIMEKYTPKEVSLLSGPYINLNRVKLEKLLEFFNVTIKFIRRKNIPGRLSSIKTIQSMPEIQIRSRDSQDGE
jgi:hypothetical protein